MWVPDKTEATLAWAWPLTQKRNAAQSKRAHKNSARSWKVSGASVRTQKLFSELSCKLEQCGTSSWHGQPKRSLHPRLLVGVWRFGSESSGRTRFLSGGLLRSTKPCHPICRRKKKLIAAYSYRNFPMLILVLDSKLWLAGHMLSKWALHMRIQFHFLFYYYFWPETKEREWTYSLVVFTCSYEGQKHGVVLKALQYEGSSINRPT